MEVHVTQKFSASSKAMSTPRKPYPLRYKPQVSVMHSCPKMHQAYGSISAFQQNSELCGHYCWKENGLQVQKQGNHGLNSQMKIALQSLLLLPYITGIPNSGPLHPTPNPHPRSVLGLWPVRHQAAQQEGSRGKAREASPVFAAAPQHYYHPSAPHQIIGH